MLHSLCTEDLEKYVQKCIKERKEEMENKNNLVVEIRPEFKAALSKSELLDTVSAIVDTDFLRMLAEALMHYALAARNVGPRSRLRLTDSESLRRRRNIRNSKPWSTSSRRKTAAYSSASITYRRRTRTMAKRGWTITTSAGTCEVCVKRSS